MTMLESVMLVLVGVVVVAWLTAGATAVRCVSRIWLRHWAERRLRGAAAASMYLERPHRLLMAASASISLAVALIGIAVGRWPLRGPAAVVGAVVGAAVLVLVVGQIMPRVIARRWGAALVPVTLPVLRLAELVSAPLLAAGGALARRLPRRAGMPAEPTPGAAIQDLLRDGELEGVGERDEIAIIRGVVAFGAKTARDVMTPGTEMFALRMHMPPDAFALAIAQAGYSRVPVYDGTTDDVLGMVHAFDVLKGRGEVLPPVRPLLSVPPERLCSDLLFQMLRERIHLAIVRDADRSVLGLVTLEDVLEELVGDIRDEHDEPAPPDLPPEAAPLAHHARPSRST